MAVDGLLLYTITQQLQALTPCKINKIQNISDEEIQLQVHTRNKGNQRIILNVRSNTNRVYLSTQQKSTQANPSNFVMVLRKQCSQSIITSIEQIHFDRILCFHLSNRNEFGDFVEYKLYVELMGKYANILLVRHDDIIIDALKRIPVYENSKRFIHPGAQYKLPKQEKKQIPTDIHDIDFEQSLVPQIYGFSPLLSTEFLYRMNQGQTYQEILDELLQSPSLYVYEQDFHCIPLKHLNQKAQVYPFMDGLAHLFQEKEQKVRIKEQCGDVFRTVEKEWKKEKKKLPKLLDALEKSKNHQKYKEYGDLLFAYIGQIKKQPIVSLTSFETGQTIDIPIDMRLDIKGNANKYYQKYHKLKRSLSILQEQIEQCKNEIAYYGQLYQQLQCSSVEDALEIREELIQNRVMFQKKSLRRYKKKSVPNVLQLQVGSSEIFIGKNNLQNNYITHKLARRQDLWFHVKDYHGSHVLLKSQNVSEEEIRMCAHLAAYYSKGQLSSSVPVDYCPISQLKKVPGSKIGFVTMKNYKTIYIDPNQTQVEGWIEEFKKR